MNLQQLRPLLAPQSLPLSPPSPPAASPPPAQQRPASTPCERVTNVSNNPAFKEFKERGLPLNTVRETAAAAGKYIPKNAAGTEMCLSYHVSGFCSGNCSRPEGHCPHTAPERKDLLDWCKECYYKGGPSEGGARGCY